MILQTIAKLLAAILIVSATPSFAKQRSKRAIKSSLAGYSGLGAKGRYGNYGLGVMNNSSNNGYAGQFSYVTRMSVTAPIGDSETAVSPHAGHGGHGESSSVTPMFGGMIGYGLTAHTSLDFMIMHMGEMGLMDPTLALSYNYQLNRKSRLIPSIKASLPLSEMSSQMGIMSQLTAKVGYLRTSNRKLRMFTNLKAATTLYNGEADEMDGHSMAGMDHGQHNMGNATPHDHSQHSGTDTMNQNNAGNKDHSGGMDHNNMSGMEHIGGMDHGSMSGMDQNGGMGHGNMSGMNLVTMENHDEHAGMDHGSMARQTMTVGVDFGYYYSPKSKWQLGSKMDVNTLSYDDGSSAWTNTLVLAELSYATQGFMDMGTSTMPMGIAAYTSLNVSEKAENFTAIPSNPALVVGVAYGGM